MQKVVNFILIGVYILTAWFGFLVFVKPHFQSVHIVSIVNQRNFPKKIVIPSSQINLKVAQGGTNNNTWILSDTDALYLPTTGKLGEGFNTVIYAHDREGMFADLKNVNLGDKVLVTDTKNKVFTYQVIEKESIDPSQVDELKSVIPNSLTLFTCDGVLDNQRILIRAKIVYS